MLYIYKLLINKYFMPTVIKLLLIPDIQLMFISFILNFIRNNQQLITGDNYHQ